LFILVKNRREVYGIIIFYLASHIVLDLFDGGIFVLYPACNNVFFARAELLFIQNSFAPVLDYGISKKIMNMGRGEPVISSENIGVTVLFIVIVAVLCMRNLIKKK
jgi:hypothetical protein